MRRMASLASFPFMLALALGAYATGSGQTVTTPAPIRPGDCVLPLPPSPQDPPGTQGVPEEPRFIRGLASIPPIPPLTLPTLDDALVAFVDPIDRLLADLPVGGTGDDSSMLGMIDQFLGEVDTQRLFVLAHQLHVQLTRRSARIWVIDANGPARLHECATRDPNMLRRAFALVALYKEGHAPETWYLEATDPFVRIAALRWLAPPLGITESRATKVVDRLLEDAKHYHAGVRSAAARALGNWAFTPEAVDGLKTLASSDADASVRAAALEGLAAVHSLEVRNTLTAIWRSENHPTSDRDAAYAALRQTGILPEPR